MFCCIIHPKNTHIESNFNIDTTLCIAAHWLQNNQNTKTHFTAIYSQRMVKNFRVQPTNTHIESNVNTDITLCIAHWLQNNQNTFHC